VIEHGRALLTINRRHFVRLHERNPEHSGIIACSLDLDFGGQAKRISAALAAKESLARELRVNRPG
jgi:hypothetical protein